MKKCPECEKLLLSNFFSKKSGEVCVICDHNKNGSEKVEQKVHKYEVVEDKSCAGGACTL